MKKGIIPIIALILGMIIFEAIVIYIFNWSGIYRSIIAAIVGGICFEAGKKIESKILKYDNKSSNNTLLNFIAFITIVILIVGMTFHKSRIDTSSINVSISENILANVTDKHIDIPTTQISIIPPSNYIFNDELLRFYKNEKTYFQIVEMQGTDFSKNELSKTYLENKGAEVLYWKEFTLSEKPAKLCIAKSSNETRNIFLTFGDNLFTTVIAAYYPSNDTTSEREILTSILTIYYDGKKEINPFENAKFKIELSNGDYKFARYASNTYIFTKDGTIDEKNPYQPQFIIGQVPSVGLSNESLRKYSGSLISSYESSCNFKLNITTSKPIEVNGSFGYLTICEGKTQETDISVYLLVITSINTTISFSGIATTDIMNDMKMFERVSKTLTIKK